MFTTHIIIGAQGVVVCFDLTQQTDPYQENKSLARAIQIKHELDKESETKNWLKPAYILVACKDDLATCYLDHKHMDNIVNVWFLSLFFFFLSSPEYPGTLSFGSTSFVSFCVGLFWV